MQGRQTGTSPQRTDRREGQRGNYALKSPHPENGLSLLDRSMHDERTGWVYAPAALPTAPIG
jgi:hypothetical protein